VRAVRSLEVWLRIPLDVWIFLTVCFIVATEGNLAHNTGTVLRPWANALVEFELSFDTGENGSDGIAYTKLETVASLSLSFLSLQLWSIGHPWNALFQVSLLILRDSVWFLGRGISSSQGRSLHKHRLKGRAVAQAVSRWLRCSCSGGTTMKWALWGMPVSSFLPPLLLQGFNNLWQNMSHLLTPRINSSPSQTILTAYFCKYHLRIRNHISYIQ
jgi:hypothetical protein